MEIQYFFSFSFVMQVSDKWHSHSDEVTRMWTEADEFIRNLNEVFSGLVIVPDSVNLNRIEEIARTYSLLPNDALIIATCREHTIHKITTFDKDFSRIKNPFHVKI